MTWRFQPAAVAFEDLRSEWTRLAQMQGSHPLLDVEFVGTLLRYFGKPDVLVGARTDSGRPGVVLVVKKAPGIWETFQPSQAPLGLILFGHQDDTGNDLLDLLAGLPGYALQFGVMQQDSQYAAAPPTLSGKRFERLPHIRTPRLQLQGTFEEYWASRSKKLRENLRRYRRRLEGQGHRLEFVACRAAEQMAACIREYGRLESGGWKGKEGSAVSEENVQGAFYREVLERFCARGQGAVYQLLLDGKAVASRLTLSSNAMLVMLKTAYDEQYAQFAPGILLVEELLKHLYAEGQIRAIEFYGQVKEWHTHFTEESRELYHVNVFRHPCVAAVRKFAKGLR